MMPPHGDRRGTPLGPAEEFKQDVSALPDSGIGRRAVQRIFGETVCRKMSIVRVPTARNSFHEPAKIHGGDRTRHRADTLNAASTAGAQSCDATDNQTNLTST